MNRIGNIVENFQVEDFGEAKIRYPSMKDAEEMTEYLNTLVEEKAEIARQEKISVEEEMEWLLDHLKGVMKKKQVGLVVDVDDKIMGHGYVKKKEEAMSHVGKLALGLRKEIRGKGVGSKLMGSLLQEAEEKLDVEIITLGVFHTNRVARNLYKKFGFEKTGELEDGIKQYGEYKNLIRMKKDLRK